MAESANSTLAGRAAFSHPDFVRFQGARFFIVITLEMQSVAVGWQVYEITKRPLDLGLVGLAQFLPGILLFLVSGQAVDRFNRRKLLTLCYGGFALCSGLLLSIAWHGVHSAYAIYVVMALVGAVRSLNGPTARAILPQLVPEQHFPNAVAWNASIFQTATILGPAFGGLLYAFSHGPSAVYGTATLIAVASMLSTLRIKPRTTRRLRQEISLTTVFAGFRYIWQQKLILGSIS